MHNKENKEVFRAFMAAQRALVIQEKLEKEALSA